MIHKHEYVANDIPDDTIVWKYFTIEKFLWFISHRELFFCCVDNFDDKTEFPVSDVLANQYRMSIDDLSKETIRIKKKSYANCWTISDNESFEMWYKYADLRTGVALRSTVSKVMKCYKGKTNITLGKVRYLHQYESPQPQDEPLNFLYIVFSKLNQFENERELRLSYELGTNEKPYNGINIDVETLVDRIIVAPFAEEYFIGLIRDIIGHYKINCNVSCSALLKFFIGKACSHE